MKKIRLWNVQDFQDLQNSIWIEIFKTEKSSQDFPEILRYRVIGSKLVRLKNCETPTCAYFKTDSSLRTYVEWENFSSKRERERERKYVSTCM